MKNILIFALISVMLLQTFFSSRSEQFNTEKFYRNISIEINKNLSKDYTNFSPKETKKIIYIANKFFKKMKKIPQLQLTLEKKLFQDEENKKIL
ncbi:hypothetical protein AAEX28_06675 [Lentisphaerota bacterium WC36G]|nr:hypothetical protein LJT99_09540 [Lentisphaerae bacterium WC36]